MPPIRSSRTSHTPIDLLLTRPSHSQHASRHQPHVITLPGRTFTQSAAIHQLFTSNTLHTRINALPDDDDTKALLATWTALYDAATEMQSFADDSAQIIEGYLRAHRFTTTMYAQARTIAVSSVFAYAPPGLLDPPEPDVIDLTQDDTPVEVPIPRHTLRRTRNQPPVTRISQASQTSRSVSPIPEHPPAPAATPDPDYTSPSLLATDLQDIGLMGPLRCLSHTETEHQFSTDKCSCSLYICPFCHKREPGHIVTDCEDFGQDDHGSWLDTETLAARQLLQQTLTSSRPASR